MTTFPQPSQPPNAPTPALEYRLPAAAATLAAIGIYAFTPADIQPLFVRIPVVICAFVMLIVTVAVNPVRMKRSEPWIRFISVFLASLLVVANSVALVSVMILLFSGGDRDGRSILLVAAEIWLAMVISFALLFWELDRGGPVLRRTAPRAELPPADFLFPQDSDSTAVREVSEDSSQLGNWRPGFADYFYEAAVGVMSFGPGVASALRHRTKLLLLTESLGGFVLLVLVIAHAVSRLA